MRSRGLVGNVTRPHALVMFGLCIVIALVALHPRATEARKRRVSTSGVVAQAVTLPPLPAGWPQRVEMGMADAPGGAAAIRATAPFAFRYQYLAGGVNTGNGWAAWNTNGQFVTYYIQDSVANGIIPVFTYYMIRQSSPGDAQNEPDGVYNNLQNAVTMASYWNDLKLFFQRAGAFPSNKVVLHMEPDFWGYMEQRSTGDNAGTVPAQVASSGVADVAGYMNTVTGFAQAVKHLRDVYAPNVLLAYHMSVWGTGDDLIYSNPSDATLDAEGRRAGNFYNSLATNFDITFGDPSDRDAAFKQYQYGDSGASWWDAGDYARDARFIAKFVQVTQKRMALWQIPLGNTKMRAEDNSWAHYQDNHVEWWFDDPARTHLDAFTQAGVVAYMFGGGAGGTTCACDAAGDGVTNPAPINGNTLMSLSADDDGGFFRQKAAAYYATGAILLTSSATPTPTATPSPTRTATSTPTRTAGATRTPEIAKPRNETIVPLP